MSARRCMFEVRVVEKNPNPKEIIAYGWNVVMCDKPSHPEEIVSNTPEMAV